MAQQQRNIDEDEEEEEENDEADEESHPIDGAVVIDDDVARAREARERRNLQELSAGGPFGRLDTDNSEGVDDLEDEEDSALMKEYQQQRLHNLMRLHEVVTALEAKVREAEAEDDTETADKVRRMIEKKKDDFGLQLHISDTDARVVLAKRKQSRIESRTAEVVGELEQEFDGDALNPFSGSVAAAPSLSSGGFNIRGRSGLPIRGNAEKTGSYRSNEARAGLLSQTAARA